MIEPLVINYRLGPGREKAPGRPGWGCWRKDGTFTVLLVIGFIFLFNNVSTCSCCPVFCFTACKYTKVDKGKCPGHDIGTTIVGEKHSICRVKCDSIKDCAGYWFKIKARTPTCQLKSTICAVLENAGEAKVGAMWQKGRKRGNIAP
jgi:hypothetical protein